MFKIIIKESKHSMKAVAKEFKDKLSDLQIRKATATSLNAEGSRAMARQRKLVREQYTISNKYIMRQSKFIHKAKSTGGDMYATIGYETMTIPAIAFKHKSLDRNSKKFISYTTKRNGVQLEIKKGRVKTLRNHFIKTMKSGHEGIWFHGRYEGSKMIISRMTTQRRSKTGKQLHRLRITEMKSSSPFTMFTNRDIQKEIDKMLEQRLPNTLRALLQGQVDRMK